MFSVPEGPVRGGWGTKNSQGGKRRMAWALVLVAVVVQTCTGQQTSVTCNANIGPCELAGHKARYATLTAGVSSLPVPRGTIASQISSLVHGSLPLAWNAASTGIQPYMVLHPIGAGQVLAVGHDGILSNMGFPATTGNFSRLLQNVIAAHAPGGGRRIAMSNRESNATVLNISRHLVSVYGTSITFRTAPAADINIANTDVWIATAPTAGATVTTNALASFVSAGGLLVIGGQSWSLGAKFKESPLYRVFSQHGLIHHGWEFIQSTSNRTFNDISKGPPAPWGYFSGAADLLSIRPGAIAKADPSSNVFSDDVVGQASTLIRNVFGGQVINLAREYILGPGNTVLNTVLGAAKASPLYSQPIGYWNPMNRTIDGVQTFFEAIDTYSMYAHPGVMEEAPHTKYFPGSVSAAATALRSVTVPVNVTFGMWARYHQPFTFMHLGNPTQADWRSTGYYALPGEQVTVTIPAQYVGEGLMVQVGVHVDVCWDARALDKMTYYKYPGNLARRFPITSTTTTVGLPFGGPIFILAPPGCDAGVIDVTLEGMMAPMFIWTRRKNTLADWNAYKSDTTKYAPWYEINSDQIIFTFPAANASLLADPIMFTDFYEAQMEAHKELANAPYFRRQERWVFDAQATYGGLHAGYPIVGPMWQGVPPNHPMLQKILDMQMRNVRRNSTTGRWSYVNIGDGVTDPTWGSLHEVGHTWQMENFLVKDAMEWYVNLFTLYGEERVLGHVRRNRTDTLRFGIPNRTKTILPAWCTSNSYNNYDAWLGIELYAQLVDGFGWGPIRTILGEYHNLPNGTIFTQQQRWDEQAIRFSRITGRDLTHFFADDWLWPLSPEARQAIQAMNLPTWTHPFMDGCTHVVGGTYAYTPASTTGIKATAPTTGTTAPASWEPWNVFWSLS